MGLLNSVGIGIGAAAQAAQPFILNMQQAEIQKLRDERMAEIEKNKVKYASDLSLDNEQTIYDRKLAREPEETAREIAKKGLFNVSAANLEDQRRNDPEYLKGVAAEAKARHIEPVDRDAEGRKLRNDEQRIKNDALGKQVGYTEGLRIAEENLANTKPGTPEHKKATEDVASYRRAINVTKQGHDDPLSSKVAAAKALLSDMDATDEQKAAAREFLSSNLKSAGNGVNTIKAPPAALEFLKKNPDQKDAFKAKYGYLPEGM